MTDADEFRRAREAVPKGSNFSKFRGDWGRLVRASRLSAAAKVVGWAIAERVNRSTGEAFPGIATIKSDAGLSRDTVVRAIKELQQAGLLAVLRGRRINEIGKRISNLYTLTIPRTVRSSDRSSTEQSHSDGLIAPPKQSDFAVQTVRGSDRNLNQPTSKPSKTKQYDYEAAERRLAHLFGGGNEYQGHEDLQAFAPEARERFVKLFAQRQFDTLADELKVACAGTKFENRACSVAAALTKLKAVIAG